MKLFCFAVALVLLLGCGLATAQSPATRPDAQSDYEPRSGPGAGQTFLAQFAGNWNVEKTFLPASAAPVKVSGECKQSMINGGRFLKSEFVFGSGQDETTGTGIIGFDAGSGRFTSVWVDSRSTRMSIRQSDDTFDGKEIVLYSRSLNNATTQPSRRSHTVTLLEDNGNKIVHRQYVPSPDGSERLVMELIMTRRSPATQPSR